MFAGFVSLGSTLRIKLQVKASGTTGVPAQADTGTVKFRPYGQSGNLSTANGSGAQAESGSITGATDANPIVITSTAHGLTNGMRVTITGVGGNTNANTTATVANVATNTFELAGVAGNSAYTSGGTWVTTGLYNLDVVCSGANGFEQGKTYSLLVTFAISGTVYSILYSFTVC